MLLIITIRAENFVYLIQNNKIFMEKY